MNEKITVLISDDNNEFATTLANYLEKDEDMQVVGMAKDGEEALSIISTLKPDVVLLDVIMPHLDGLGVLERLSSMRLEKRPICIMLSAVGQDKITQKAITLGAQYYVVKPFDIEVLIKRIKELKYYQPSTNRGSFIVKETKSQYIDIPQQIDKKSEDGLEALVTNIIHEVGVPAHINRYNKPNNKTTVSRHSQEIPHYAKPCRACDSPCYRSRMGQRRTSSCRKHIWLYSICKQGKTNEFGIYSNDS